MVVSPLWRGPGYIRGFIVDEKSYCYCSNTNCDRRFRCEDNNVDLTHVQPHYYRVWQVEPCHQLG